MPTPAPPGSPLVGCRGIFDLFLTLNRPHADGAVMADRPPCVTVSLGVRGFAGEPCGAVTGARRVAVGWTPIAVCSCRPVSKGSAR